MKINCFSPTLSVNKDYNNVQNFKFKALEKDIVSFSARKDEIDLSLIDDKKILESIKRVLSKQKVSRGEYINILKFFGFEKEGKRQNKESYTRNPYGTKIQVPADQEVPMSFVVKLGDALKQVNTMNGELYFGEEREKFIKDTSNTPNETDKNRYRHNLEQRLNSEKQNTEASQEDELLIKKQSEIEYTQRKQQESIENEKIRQLHEKKQKQIDAIEDEIKEIRQMISSELKEWKNIIEDVSELKKDKINIVLFEYIDAIVEEVEKQSQILKEKKKEIREAEAKLANTNTESTEEEIEEIKTTVEQLSYSVLERIEESKKTINEKQENLIKKMTEEELALPAHNKERFERITVWFKQTKTDKDMDTIHSDQIKMDLEPQQEAETIRPKEEPINVKPKETEEIKKAEEQQDVKTAETRTSEIITKLSRKLIPFANKKANQDINDLLNKSLSNDELNILANGDFNSSSSLISTKVRSIVKTNEYRQIINSLTYAFLNTVYDNAQNPPASIFELGIEDIKKLSSSLAYGKTSVNIDGYEIFVPENIDTNKVETMYEDFKQPLSEEEMEQIKTLLMQYCDDISIDNEIKMEDLLKKQTRYLTILLDNTKPEEVKISLIKSFWNLFDVNNGTNIKAEVIESYKQVKLHEEKLKALDEMDSDDFEVEIF